MSFRALANTLCEGALILNDWLEKELTYDFNFESGRMPSHLPVWPDWVEYINFVRAAVDRCRRNPKESPFAAFAEQIAALESAEAAAWEMARWLPIRIDDGFALAETTIDLAQALMNRCYEVGGKLADIGRVVDAQEAEPRPTLAASESKVLQALQEATGPMMTVDIAAATDLTGRTVKPAVARLIDLDLASRPHGPRKGAVITDKGSSFLSR